MLTRVPQWLTIAALALCGMVASLQFTLAIPILPPMPDLLGVSPGNASWIVTATLLTSTIATPILSRMADMYGKRRMLVISMLVMVAGSIIAAVGGTFAWVVVGRALQGFASALIPVGISLLRDQLSKDRVGSAIALMSATLGIGGALGMPLSGVLFNQFGWHAIFWFTAIAGLFFSASALLFVRESEVRTPGRFDVVGAVLLSAILTAALMVISKGATWGWGSPLVLGLTLAAVAGATVWVPLQLRTNQPMVDLRTAARRPVLLTNTASIFTTAGMFSNMLITTQQVQTSTASGYGFGLTIVGAGLVMLPSGLVQVALAPVAGRLLDRWGGRPVLIFGNTIMAASLVFRIVADDSVLMIIIGAALVGIGVSLAFAAMPALIMSAVPITETASANGLNSLVRSLGTSICSAVVALLFSAMTIQVGDHVYPSLAAIHLGYGIGAVCSALAGGIAILIPVAARSTALAKPKDGLETLVHGRVRLATVPGPGEPSFRHPAVVTFMNLDGTPADWTRADLDGRYSAVLPGPGRYLVVANAVGWAPSTQVLDFSSHRSDMDLLLADRLCLTGTVTRGDQPAGGALVALNRVEGEYAATVTSDEAGRYSVPLPLAGLYIITAIDPAGEWAHSRKISISVRPETADLDVPVLSR